MRAPPATSRIAIQTLLWIWIVVIVGFFSLSAGKQDLYIYPIVPAIVALAGVVIARSLEAEASDAPRIGIVTAVIGALLIVSGAGFLVLFNSALAVYVLDGSALVGVAAIAGGAVAMLLAWRQRAGAALVAIACALIVVNWMFVLKVLPSFEAYKPAPGLAAVLKERAGPDDLIVTYNVALPSLVYYLRRHIEVFYDHDPVLELLHSGRPVFLMVSRDDYERDDQTRRESPAVSGQLAARPSTSS